MTEQDKILSEVTDSDYKYGFKTEIDTETIPKGLNEDVVRLISTKKEEPEWLLEARLKAFRHWQTMKMPEWAHLEIPEINYQDIIYYAAPKQKKQLDSLDEVDPELLRTYEKLGIPLKEQMILAGVEGAEDAPADARKVAVFLMALGPQVGGKVMAKALHQVWLRMTGRYHRFGYAAVSFGEPLSLRTFGAAVGADVVPLPAPTGALRDPTDPSVFTAGTKPGTADPIQLLATGGARTNSRPGGAQTSAGFTRRRL